MVQEKLSSLCLSKSQGKLSVTNLLNPDEFIFIEKEDAPEKCKGLIFRYTSESWIGSQGDVNYSKRMRHIKSLSCPGCDQCGWMWDDLGEEIANDGGTSFLAHNNFRTNQLYRFKIIRYSTDWETGYADDIEYGFVPIEEK